MGLQQLKVVQPFEIQNKDVAEAIFKIIEKQAESKFEQLEKNLEEAKKYRDQTLVARNQALEDQQKIQKILEDIEEDIKAGLSENIKQQLEQFKTLSLL